MKAHARYLKYLLRHKWYVLQECWTLGIPWLGLVHDLSKVLLRTEWLPYVRHFYGDYARAKRTLDSQMVDREVEAKFDRSWLTHQHRNKHHWQYWVLRKDDNTVRLIEMPDRYRREMLADWRGAGRALGKSDTAAWYWQNRAAILLAPETRKWIEGELGVMQVSEGCTCKST